LLSACRLIAGCYDLYAVDVPKRFCTYATIFRQTEHTSEIKMAWSWLAVMIMLQT
jgi:hypothetical protein